MTLKIKNRLLLTIFKGLINIDSEKSREGRKIPPPWIRDPPYCTVTFSSSPIYKSDIHFNLNETVTQATVVEVGLLILNEGDEVMSPLFMLNKPTSTPFITWPSPSN